MQLIFAGQRSAFAYSAVVSNKMKDFIGEFKRLNEEAKADPLPQNVKEIQTADGKSFLVSTSIWECYVAGDSKQVSLPLPAAEFLFRLLTGELQDNMITDWVKK